MAFQKPDCLEHEVKNQILLQNDCQKISLKFPFNLYIPFHLGEAGPLFHMWVLNKCLINFIACEVDFFNEKKNMSDYITVFFYLPTQPLVVLKQSLQDVEWQ